MNRLRIFISSVQSEFAEERQMLFHYLNSDALLGRFFEPFIFEKMPAADMKVSEAFLEQVNMADVYLGIFGKDYGFENNEGISPTELEFNYATALHKIRLIFISRNEPFERHPKELMLIQKAEETVVRKMLNNASELKTNVYASLVNLLEEKELIRTGPFDATICREASLTDIDYERIKWFVREARAKRGFPLSPEEIPERILTHLNLIKNEQPTNAAILLFGNQPQRFFITAEIRCAMFHGNDVQKPIPAYQVYKGDVFQQVNQAVDFVLSRIDLTVGDRSRSVDAPIEYEIPPSAVIEAIVNAVAHRDYTSNASVQVMLFRNRLEVLNPGQLPYHLPVSKLKLPHSSYPANPLLAEPMYLAGFIERMGTGIPDMIKACLDAGLKEPDLVQEESFKTILWRKAEITEQITKQVTPHDTPYVAPHDTPHVSNLICRLILAIIGEMSRPELQKILGVKDIGHFRESYLIPALMNGFIEMTLQNKPRSKNQRYRLTIAGKALQHKLKNQNK